MLFESDTILLEAPNWVLDGDSLILNGDGKLWRLPLVKPILDPIEIIGLPPVNNDHVLDPDGEHIFVSTYVDYHIYRVSLAGGDATRITGKEGPAQMLHFLHGVSPDGKQLAFVGVEAERAEEEVIFRSAEICTIAANGHGFRQITTSGAMADGPEYSSDGKWLYFNTEAYSGHAQIARIRVDGGGLERLTFSQSVDWFPHLSSSGEKAVYMSYPAGTLGHPPDRWVELMLVVNHQWKQATSVARLFGGQGTINVNSWSPDGLCFAYVAYPKHDA